MVLSMKPKPIIGMAHLSACMASCLAVGGGGSLTIGGEAAVDFVVVLLF